MTHANLRIAVTSRERREKRLGIRTWDLAVAVTFPFFFSLKRSVKGMSTSVKFGWSMHGSM